MSDTSELLTASATRLFETRLTEEAVRASRRGDFTAEGWAAVEDAGLPLALLSEGEGGYGIAMAEALDLVRISGYFGSPLPLAETMLANLFLARAGLPLAEGPATIASFDGAGKAQQVPWARHAQTIVGIREGTIVRLSGDQLSVRPDFSACGLPRDAVFLVHSDAEATAPSPMDVREAGALARILEMAGALRRVAELTLAYANERVQFGRPIAKQQAIQQQLATLASQAAAADAAADFAALAFGGGHASSAIAAAKSRAGEAVGIGAAIAHQVHGAIGFTEEHRLHLYTRALWAWRDEFGNEAYWETQLGDTVLSAGADAFWPHLTDIQVHATEA